MENNIDNWGHKEFFIVGIIGAVLLTCLVLVVIVAPLAFWYLVFWYIFILFACIILITFVVMICIFVGISFITLFRMFKKFLTTTKIKEKNKPFKNNN